MPQLFQNSVNAEQIRGTISGSLRIVAATKLAELETHAPAWNDLAYRVARPMLSHAWIASFLEYQLEKKQSWICLLAYHDLELVGVLPLMVISIKVMGREYLKLQTPFNWHTPCVDFLIKPGLEDEVIHKFLTTIKEFSPRLHCLKIRRLLASTSILNMAKDGLPGFSSLSRFNGNGSYIEVDGSFDEYREGLKRGFVRNLNRLERKLGRLGGSQIEFISENAGNPEYLQTFLEIEESCWKGRNGSAIGQCSSQLAFYTALTCRLACLGWLEWHFLKASGKTIAANLAIRMDHRLVVLKIAYDETFSSYSPGTKLFEKMIQHAFDIDEISEIDCLSEYPWNRNWRMQTRPYYDLSIYPSRLTNLLFGYIPEKIYYSICHLPFLNYSCHICGRMISRFKTGPDPQNRTCCLNKKTKS